LLLELQASRALTYLLISHDLRFVANIAHFVAVMSEGRIVEQGPTQRIVSTPSHASTRALLASAQTSAQNLRQALGASS
jgi:ABC-type glutathione transport system ATPase component